MERQLAFYAEDYGGSKIPLSQRKQLLYRATCWLNLLTNPCPALRAEQEEALLFAICAAAPFTTWSRVGSCGRPMGI